MADCTIVKRRYGWRHDPASGRTRALKKWCPVCPTCGPLVLHDRTWPNLEPFVPTYMSRKLAKDALYRHRRDAGH